MSEQDLVRVCELLPTHCAPLYRGVGLVQVRRLISTPVPTPHVLGHGVFTVHGPYADQPPFTMKGKKEVFYLTTHSTHFVFTDISIRITHTCIHTYIAYIHSLHTHTYIHTDTYMHTYIYIHTYRAGLKPIGPFAPNWVLRLRGPRARV